jgi:hypothetical protein
MIMRQAFFFLALPFLLTGCLGYKVGPTNGIEAGSRSIQIAPPVNSTYEPRVSDAVAQALRRQIQRDGTYHLNTRGDGDILVTTTITHYDRQGITFQPGDTLTVRDYRVTLHAHVNAFDRVTGKTLVNRDFRGRTDVRVGSDLSSAERQALPLLAEDLARNVTSALADGEW